MPTVLDFETLMWKSALRNIITDPKILCQRLNLPDDLISQNSFPLRVTESFLARMKKGNPQDPLLLQVLTSLQENLNDQGQIDPLEENNYLKQPGLIQKYQGRALVTVTQACAIHCRYCFRRHFPYAENALGKQGWERITNYLQNDTSITEIILSGGDPLMLNDEALQEIFVALEKIPHLKRIRIHTRIPSVLPERITAKLIDVFKATNLALVVVVHINHPNEINDEVKQACQKLKPHATLLNQSVLLKNINDNAETLTQLSEKLFEAGVLPYYLHTFDPVRGAMHFDISVEDAKILHKKIARVLPGYLVPKLVKEIPREPFKTVLR